MKHQHSFIHLWLNLQKETSMLYPQWPSSPGAKDSVKSCPPICLELNMGTTKFARRERNRLRNRGSKFALRRFRKCETINYLWLVLEGRCLVDPNSLWSWYPTSPESTIKNLHGPTKKKIEHNKNWHWFEPLRKGEKVKTVVFFNTPLTIGPCDVFSFL